MQEVRQRATKICCTNIPILLVGGGGTGKELLARWIHKQSPIGNGNFVKVNCAAIPGTLLESELFGYEKGAFTGAYATKPGRVELADNGTLFLDEIADLDIGLQSKLLQFLQDGRFSRIGDEFERVVNTRLICATHLDLEQGISSGTFRADLFYRINVVCLRLPKLRDRREDIPMLAEYFFGIFQERFAKHADPLNKETVQYLENLDWPGNIRELSNSIARYVLIGSEGAFAHERAFRPSPSGALGTVVSETLPLKEIAKEAIRDKERKLILDALHANQWNRRKTAQALKISYRTLIYKIRNAGFVSRRPNALPSTESVQGTPLARSSD
jgi:two-component system response regulator AtoC